MHVEKISVACLVLKSRMEFSDLAPKYSSLSFMTIYYHDVIMKKLKATIHTKDRTSYTNRNFMKVIIVLITHLYAGRKGKTRRLVNLE